MCVLKKTAFSRIYSVLLSCTNYCLTRLKTLWKYPTPFAEQSSSTWTSNQTSSQCIRLRVISVYRSISKPDIKSTAQGHFRACLTSMYTWSWHQKVTLSIRTYRMGCNHKHFSILKFVLTGSAGESSRSHNYRRNRSALKCCCTAMWKANGKATTLLIFLDSIFPKPDTNVRCLCPAWNIKKKGWLDWSHLAWGLPSKTRYWRKDRDKDSDGKTKKK